MSEPQSAAADRPGATIQCMRCDGDLVSPLVALSLCDNQVRRPRIDLNTIRAARPEPV